MEVFNLAEKLEEERKKNKELEEENEKLKRIQVNVLNRIKDFISLSKCEAVEGNYTTDNHSKYWNLFRKFAEELKDKIKGIETEEYVYIPKWREEELLNLESRIDKAIEYIENGELLYLANKNSIIYQNNIEVVAVRDRINNLLNILKGDNK